MKILHIAFASPFSEEMSYQENLITKYQAKDGHEVIILTTCYEWHKSGNLVFVPPVNKIMQNGVRLIRMKYSKVLTNFITDKIRKVKGVYKILEEFRPGIIFFHCPQSIELLTIIQYVKKESNVKLFIDNHADFNNSATNIISLWFLHKVLWRYVTKKAEPFTTMFFGVLPSRVDFLIKVYKVSRIKCELLTMGADDDKVTYVKNNNIREQIRIKYGFSSNDFVIVTGGKIDKTKNQTLLLIKAIQGLNAENIKLLVFGSIIDELKDLILSFVDNKKIFYLGWIDSDKIYSCFAASDLAVFPGSHSVLWEEAVGTGIPCLFKYWKGTEHVDVGGNCRFLYDDKVSEIKRVLEEIILNPEEYLKMKSAAVEIGISRFSYREIARRVIQF